MFKEEIAIALKTKFKSFGLSNEAIDRIASAREKTVTEQDQVETAVSDAETMGLIAGELQKMRDAEIQKRTDTQRAFDTYKEKHPETGEGGGDGGDGKGGLTAEQVAELIRTGVADGIKDIKAAFENFKTQTSAKEAKTIAKETFYGNKWTTRFKEEADDAWDRASELNDAMGGKMTAKELSDKATEYFKAYAGRKGSDITKPFESDGDGKGDFDFSSQAKYLEGEGLIPPESK